MLTLFQNLKVEIKKMKIIVNNQYTYETEEKAEIGDEVVLPSPSWLRDVNGPTWTGKVTATKSDYDGYCSKVIKVIK